jgi:thioredoxin reductase
MRISEGARVAIVGGGPSGIVSARFALEAGFDVTVFEASDRLGGQWYTAADHSGVWPGMHTNTSRMMTAFSDLAAPAEHPLHPAAEQIAAYLHSYAEEFDIPRHVRLGTEVRHVQPGWRVDGEPFDAVILASGLFRKPLIPPAAGKFGGQLLHSFNYTGADPFAGQSVVVYGNGISGLEVASDLAGRGPVVSAFRKPRYVIQKVVDGVPSDWQWYTLFGALERRVLPSEEWSRRQRERVIRLAGSPADFGAPTPDDDLRRAGISLCQDYLAQIQEGSIVCRPEISSIEGKTITFSDGSSTRADALICATGYELDLPYLDPDITGLLGPALNLYQRTFHPDLPGFGVVGQFMLQGPYFPLLELQARWIAAVWSGQVGFPDEARIGRVMAQPRPPIDAHNALALTLSEELGVSPEPADLPELSEPLMFGPMLPPRYRLCGPGARADAPELFRGQLASSPRAPVDTEELGALATRR